MRQHSARTGTEVQAISDWNSAERTSIHPQSGRSVACGRKPGQSCARCCKSAKNRRRSNRNRDRQLTRPCDLRWRQDWNVKFELMGWQQAESGFFGELANMVRWAYCTDLQYAPVVDPSNNSVSNDPSGE